ncbi:MAG: phosphate signaling complex protein PhoU [Candidatus Brocadiia bacterium]
MPKHLQRELDRLKKRILSLGALAEQNVRTAVLALERRDADRAEQVIAADPEIDQAEVETEEECLKVLALHQPVAIDLRFIVAVLKINNDLERIGDLAVNIAERALYLATHEARTFTFDFQGMADKTQQMLKKSLDALVNMDAAAAREVCRADDEVDAYNRDMYIQVQEAIREDVGQLRGLIHLLSASRHLERIADHTTNIAEDVIYMVEGEIIRHRAEDYREEAGGEDAR